MALLIGGQSAATQLGNVGAVIDARLDAPTPGWWPVTAEIDADEFRADDRRSTLVRVLPVARAQWDPADHYLDAAAVTLRAGGRLVDGTEVTLGWLGPGHRSCRPPPTSRQWARSIGRWSGAACRGGSAGRSSSPSARDSGPLLGPTAVTRRVRLVHMGRRAARRRGHRRGRSVDCPLR